MKIPKILSIFLSLVFLVSGAAFGVTLHVPSEYATIQAAISVSTNGDTVVVAPGSYSGPIFLGDKTITVRSESGPNVTTIEGILDIAGGSTTIEGFKLTYGPCQSTGGHGSIWGGSSPTFINSQIINGCAGVGGGYAIRNSSATFIDCEFFENEASSNGGALYIVDSTVNIENCIFGKNTAGDSGGGIYITGNSSSEIINSNFKENNSQRYGGAIDCQHNVGDILISKCSFSKNRTELWGGALDAEYVSSLAVESCIFSENVSSGWGGAIHDSWGASITVTNSVFIGNRTLAGGGGGIKVYPGNATEIINCTFFQNHASHYGGAIDGCSPLRVSNAILWDNYAPNGQEHLCHDPDLQHIMIISYSDIDQDGFAGSNGNIRQDPLFIDPENGDVHLQYGSPCIDTGTSEGAPNYDIDRDVRPQGSSYDMGADEYLQFIEIKIDIKPGSYPNSICLKSKGKVPVAILTTDDFDACDVDPVSCEFAGAYPLRWKMEDVDNDGDHDMLFHFKTQELDLTKDSTEATLEGETYDGVQITGTDSVNIVPKGK
ncbi:MAG: right-handed parallel beta-helix repeat-containing protein [Desulfobacterales bacterium]|nr:right-handed parallel beta-helix repeat-containing protein [Desulfobacterales bacterium]